MVIMADPIAMRDGGGASDVAEEAYELVLR
jgi:hypothetical protein